MQRSKSRKKVLAILKSKIFNQSEMFPLDVSWELKKLASQYYDKYCVKHGQDDKNPASIPPPPEKSEFHNIDIKGLEVENVKEFGAEHLCRQMLDKLGIEAYFTSLGMSGEQTKKALISIAGKAIYSASEHKTSQILEMNSELSGLYNHKKNKPQTALFGYGHSL